jgi:terpene synthase-like protein
MQDQPVWYTPARAALAVPGTSEFITQLTTALMNGELQQLGPHLLKRLPASAYFAVLTFPPDQRRRFTWANAWIIEWIFGLDAALDTVPTLDYAEDLRLLLERRLDLPLDTELDHAALILTHDPAQPFPGLEYSPLTLVNAIQPLRQRIIQEAVDGTGLRLFDRYLMQCIIPSMTMEARWRLGELPYPSYANYLDVAWISISGGLCAATVAAVLPEAAGLLGATSQATRLMLQATRLCNDLATADKEAVEGKPNVVLILERELGSRAAAERRVREMTDEYAAELERLCAPYLRGSDVANPLYTMYHYIYMCWVITELMYSGGDFVAPVQIGGAL